MAIPGHGWCVKGDRVTTCAYVLRGLVLYGTLRPVGFSKLLAAEAAHLAEDLG